MPISHFLWSIHELINSILLLHKVFLPQYSPPFAQLLRSPSHSPGWGQDTLGNTPPGEGPKIGSPRSLYRLSPHAPSRFLTWEAIQHRPICSLVMADAYGAKGSSGWCTIYSASHQLVTTWASGIITTIFPTEVTKYGTILVEVLFVEVGTVLYWYSTILV